MEKDLDRKKNAITEDDVKLNDEEFQECLNRAELVTFSMAVPEEEPKSIYIFAQPGAGKTGLRMFAEAEFYSQNENSNHVSIDPDQVAMFHKNYDAIIKNFPDDSYRLLQEFVRPALDGYLRQKAVYHKVNLFQEGTFASPGYMDIMRFQKFGGNANIGERDENGVRKAVRVNGDYEIDINVLAVHRYESLLSAYEREFELIEQGLPGRAVTEKNHDYAYERMVENLVELEKSGFADRIRVFKRGYLKNKPDLIYVAGDSRYKDSVEAVLNERERNKEELIENPNTYLNRIAVLEQKINKRAESIGDFSNSENLLNKIEKLKNEFLRDVERNQEIKEGRR